MYDVGLQRMEDIQHKMIKYIVFKSIIHFQLSSRKSLKYLGQQILELRKHCSLLFFYKLVNEFIESPENLIMFQFHTPIKFIRNPPLLHVYNHMINCGSYQPLNQILQEN